MTTGTFNYPLSKTRYYEGELHITASYEDDQVTVISVIKETPSGLREDITNSLEAHGLCRQQIQLMAMNDKPEWAVHGDDRRERLQFNEVLNSYETF